MTLRGIPVGPLGPASAVVFDAATCGYRLDGPYVHQVQVVDLGGGTATLERWTGAGWAPVTEFRTGGTEFAEGELVHVADAPEALRVTFSGTGKAGLVTRRESPRAAARRRRRRAVGDPPTTWATGYFLPGGVADADGIGGITGYDGSTAIWTMLHLVEAASTNCNLGGITGPGLADVMRTQWTPPFHGSASKIYGQINPGGSWDGLPVDVPAGTLFAVAVTVDRFANTVTTRVVSDTGADSGALLTASTSEGFYGFEAWIGSYNGSLPYTGKIWGQGIVLTGPPTLAQLAGIAQKRAPWIMFAPTDVLRAWNPADAYGTENKGTWTYYIPDLAQANGGPASASNAVIRNGDIASNIVIP